MNRLVPVTTASDIPERYRDTPVGLLLEYHNTGRPHTPYSSAQLLVGMCMDNRKHLKIPENFAFVIRAGGANLRYSEFKVSYAIAVGGVHAIALIGHSQCGMVNLAARKDQFVQGLVDNAGWTREAAGDHFNSFAPMFEINDEIEFILGEVIRLRPRYPRILIAPMFYRVEDNRIYLISEKAEE